MESICMKVFRAAAMIAVLAGPAIASLTGPVCAQTPNINLMPETKSKTPEEIEQDKLTDKAYRESLRKIPESKASTDPWGSVRSTDAPKTAPSRPRTRTGSTAN